jgi:hypothetical protein
VFTSAASGSTIQPLRWSVLGIARMAELIVFATGSRDDLYRPCVEAGQRTEAFDEVRNAVHSSGQLSPRIAPHSDRRLDERRTTGGLGCLGHVAQRPRVRT